MIAEMLLDHRVVYRIEAVLVLAVVVLAAFWPAGKAAPFGRIEGAFDHLRGQFWLQALIVLALAIGLRAALLPVLGPPVPVMQDEYSLLLQAETFALGRLANPTPALHPFFETIYVNLEPFYASMYFPGRGVPMALAILVGAHPWLGVWLSMALLAAVTVWALRGWLSEGVALVGGILVVVRYGVLSGWINSYYGGGLIALGAMLVLGAYPRLMRAPRWRDGIALGLGLFLMMTSRPFEGFFFSLPFLVLGALKLFGLMRERAWSGAARMAVPVMLLTGCGAVLMLAYNSAATGELFTDPYTHNREGYAYSSPFLFGGSLEPERQVPLMVETYFSNEAGNKDIVYLTTTKARRIMGFYIGPAFLIPFLVGLIASYRRPVLWVSFGLVTLSYLLATWPWSQYFAPGFALVWLFIMTGLASLRNWRWRGRATGMVLARLLPCIALVSLILPVTALPADIPDEESLDYQVFVRPCCAVVTQSPRSRLVEKLEAIPGRDIVIIRFDPERDNSNVPLVANAPDIASADIIWAHDLGPATQMLLDRYPDRQAWIVDGTLTDRAVPIERYPATGSIDR